MALAESSTDALVAMDGTNLESFLQANGYAVLYSLLGEDDCDGLLSAIERDALDAERPHAARNLLEKSPTIRSFAQDSAVARLVRELLGCSARPVRGIFFDKVAGANWKVPWHQDVAIAVKEKREVTGYGPWSVKEGVPHVEPPAEILERMVTIRLHFDDCGDDNGPLRVLPGSHRYGRLSAEDIAALDKSAQHTCVVPRGGAVLMKPLMVHASSPAKSVSHRRVLHLEYCAAELAPELSWFEE